MKHLELLDLKKQKQIEHRNGANKTPQESQDPLNESSDESSNEEILAEAELNSTSSETETTPCATTMSTKSRGQRCTTYRTRHFFGDSDCTMLLFCLRH